MNRKFFTAFFMILFYSLITFGQEKDLWIPSFENKIKPKEAKFKIEKTVEFGSNWGSFNFFYQLTSETDRIIIRLYELPDIPNRRENICEEIFANNASEFDHIINKIVERKKLKNLGDEALIWAKYNKEGWTRIHFRKHDLENTMFLSRSQLLRKKWRENLRDTLPMKCLEPKTP